MLANLRSSAVSRGLVGATSLIALVLSFVLAFGVSSFPAPLSGARVFTGGMLAYFLLPLLLRVPIGRPAQVREGVRYVTGRSSTEQLDLYSRVLGPLSWLAFAWASAAGSRLVMAGMLGVFTGLACILLALWGLADRFVSRGADSYAVTLDRTTVTVQGVSGTHVIALADLHKVETEGARIWLTTSTDRHVIEVSRMFFGAETASTLGRAILEARDAAERAAQSETASAKLLDRPPGMGAREWLARVDALTATGRGTGAYRGGGLEEEAMWSLLRDEAAAVEARAAAARVLASSANPEVRARVTTSAKEIVDEGVRFRVEVAMKPDLEVAAAELEAMEMEELRKTSGI